MPSWTRPLKHKHTKSVSLRDKLYGRQTGQKHYNFKLLYLYRRLNIFDIVKECMLQMSFYTMLCIAILLYHVDVTFYIHTTGWQQYVSVEYPNHNPNRTIKNGIMLHIIPLTSVHSRPWKTRVSEGYM